MPSGEQLKKKHNFTSIKGKITWLLGSAGTLWVPGIRFYCPLSELL